MSSSFLRYCNALIKRNKYLLAAIADADAWMKRPLPDAMAFGSPSEARTLLEACGHLCKKIAFDELLRVSCPQVKDVDPDSFSVPEGRILFQFKSPYSEEKSPGEEMLAGGFGNSFPFTFSI
jgi:hypothetical protein